MINNYKYELKYTNGDTTVTHEFPAGRGSWELVQELRDFLCGCSWSEDAVKDMLKLEEE